MCISERHVTCAHFIELWERLVARIFFCKPLFGETLFNEFTFDDERSCKWLLCIDIPAPSLNWSSYPQIVVREGVVSW
jgi:hypothetical protein